MNELYKKLSFFIFLFGLPFLSYCQTSEKIFESALWHKNTLKVNELNSNSFKKKQPPLLNFNSPVDFEKSALSKKSKGLVTNKSSLFVVFCSTSATENDLITLQDAISKTTLTNRKLLSDKEELFHKSNPRDGVLVSHLYHKNSLASNKKGAMVFADAIYEDTMGENLMYEMIYLQKFVNPLQKEIIESYLSVKYGISLIGDRNYYNSAGDSIWDFTENRAYNRRVTGIGRDDRTSLYQKQSGNSIRDGLYIALNRIETTNAENKSALADKSFFLWGDNDGTVAFDKKTPTGLAVMDRTWKTQRTLNPAQPKEPITTQLVIHKKQMAIQRTATDIRENAMWLIIDTLAVEKINYSNAVYIKATTENDSLIAFNDVKWSHPNTLFTFAKGPDFIADYEVLAPDCSQADSKSSLSLHLFGGVAPYQVRLQSATALQNTVLNETNAVIDDLPDGDYQLEISDANKKTVKSNFNIVAVQNTGISLAPIWFLDKNQPLRITPEIENPEKILGYKWMDGDTVLATEKEWLAKTSGNYSLVVTTVSGCVKEMPFSITEKLRTADGYVLFPNPCETGNLFTLLFDFKENTKTTITIADINGKTVLFRDLGPIRKHEFRERLTVAGTYLVIVSKNGILQTTKLIIY